MNRFLSESKESDSIQWKTPLAAGRMNLTPWTEKSSMIDNNDSRRRELRSDCVEADG